MTRTAAITSEDRAAMIAQTIIDAASARISLVVTPTASLTIFSVSPAVASGSYLSVAVRDRSVRVSRVMAGGSTSGSASFEGLAADIVADAVVAMASAL